MIGVMDKVEMKEVEEITGEEEEEEEGQELLGF